MDNELIDRLMTEAGLSLSGFVVRGRDHDVHIVELRRFAELVMETQHKAATESLRRTVSRTFDDGLLTPTKEQSNG